MNSKSLCALDAIEPAARACFATGVAHAADVTFERLLNPEPQNWLMNHHDYSSQRFSPLDMINKSNIKSLKLAYAIALSGTSGNEDLEATPLVDDGFMYVPDGWGVVYKIDVRSGTHGSIVWKMDPGVQKLGPQSRRGAVEQSRHLDHRQGRPHHRHRQGDRQDRLGQEPARPARHGAHRRRSRSRTRSSSARSGGDQGVRNWVAALDRQDRRAQVEDLLDPGARRARQRDLEGQGQRLADRRRRILRHRLLRSRHQPDLLGLRQSGARL